MDGAGVSWPVMTTDDAFPGAFPDAFPDEVPLADAVDQTLPAGQADDVEGYVTDDGPAPLESNPADWHEQREILDDLDNEFR